MTGNFLRVKSWKSSVQNSIPRDYPKVPRAGTFNSDIFPVRIISWNHSRGIDLKLEFHPWDYETSFRSCSSDEVYSTKLTIRWTYIFISSIDIEVIYIKEKKGEICTVNIRYVKKNSSSFFWVIFRREATFKDYFVSSMSAYSSSM